MRALYLHGFASGPMSGKAQYFRRRFASIGMELEVPQLVEGEFEQLTISGQLQVIERIAHGDPVLLMGSSMGGYLAALYASTHPEVDRLILMAPAFRFVQRWPDELGPERTQAWQDTGRMEVFHYGENRPAYIGWNLIADGRLHDPMPSFRQPALIFHGTGDVVVPPAFSEEFAASHPTAILRLLPSDHQLTDQTDRMWSEIVPFLTSDKRD